jgi:hypothetical protein
MKKCYKCHLPKSTKQFYKNSSKHDGLSSQCKQCHEQDKKARETKNPQEAKNRKKKYKLKTFYGLTSEQYNEMLLMQRNCCYICLMTLNEHYQKYNQSFAVDHDHKTRSN